MLTAPRLGWLAAAVWAAAALAAESRPGASPAPPVKPTPTALYNTHCSGCHGKDGRANTPIAKQLGVRDLTQSQTTDLEILKQIREGRQGPGGKTLMPAFKDRLSREEEQHLVEKVRGFRKPASPATPRKSGN
jgi:mono/diheme cytochrome c family protein